jgi:hypothetical protein
VIVAIGRRLAFKRLWGLMIPAVLAGVPTGAIAGPDAGEPVDPRRDSGSDTAGAALVDTGTSGPDQTETGTTAAVAPTDSSTVSTEQVLVDLPPEAPPPKLVDTATIGQPPTGPLPPPTRIGTMELPQRLGPAWVDAGPGRIRIGLAAQLRLEILSDDSGDDRDTDVAVLVRRLRSTISGRFLDDRLTFAAQINATAGNFELVDLWLDMEFLESLRIRFGQFKIPFDWYRRQSFTRLLLADWALTTAWYGAERQFGVMVHDFGSGHGFDYGLGVFTGQNRRAGHALRLPRLYGEPVSNPSRVDGVGEIDSVHPELVGTVRHTTQGFSDASLSDLKGGPLRTLYAVSATFDANPEEARDHTARFSAETWMKFYHVSLLAMAYVGWVERTQQNDVILGTTGVNLQGAYRFQPQMEIAVQYAWVHLTRALSNDARDRGRSLIEQGPPEEQDDLELRFGDAGDLRWQQELLLGFTFFFVGHSLKWQIDAGWLHDTFRTRSENDIRMRTHLQLAF